jgi:hypothetical protein
MRPIRRPFLYLFALVAVYLADCAVFEIRLAHGTGLSTASVEQYLKTSLKGQKSEFYFQGTVSENCTRSLFPQRVALHWTPPCWWLKRHPQHWQEALIQSPLL